MGSYSFPTSDCGQTLARAKKVNKVDVDVIHARISRGFGGAFEAECVDKMARSLISGEPLEFIYNDQKYQVVSNAERV